ncbi:MAG: hypothetical protein M0036_24840 [Desulfobacteraceae bacterium]|nr:hypothetical protein [Desulfobacteraceae bacterium]
MLERLGTAWNKRVKFAITPVKRQARITGLGYLIPGQYTHQRLDLSSICQAIEKDLHTPQASINACLNPMAARACESAFNPTSINGALQKEGRPFVNFTLNERRDKEEFVTFKVKVCLPFKTMTFQKGAKQYEKEACTVDLVHNYADPDGCPLR